MFIQGNLDLAGRHRRRYTSIQHRMISFMKDFAELNSQFSTLEDVAMDECAEANTQTDVRSAVHKVVIPTAEESQLLENFEKKWQVRMCNPAVLFGLFSTCLGFYGQRN